MKIIQLTKDNYSSFNNDWMSGKKIVHIGVEHLHSLPLSKKTKIIDGNNPDMFKTTIKFEGTETFYINECDILEFGDCDIQEVLPSVSNLDDYTFITIGYEETTN